MSATTATEVERRRVVMTLGLRDHEIPKHMHDGIIEYVLRGRSTGGFLEHLLSGHLVSASRCADTANLNALPRWTVFIDDCIPAACHGSPEIVAEWKRMGGVAGMTDKTPSQGVPAIADLAQASTRPRPSMLITLSGDSLRSIEAAMRILKAEHAGPFMKREKIEDAIKTLEVAALSARAVHGEALRAIR